MWGNVYTTRNDVGSDIAREPSGRDLSGHGTRSKVSTRLPLRRCATGVSAPHLEAWQKWTP